MHSIAVMASRLADTVKTELGCKVRGIELSLLQPLRCSLRFQDRR